MSDRFFHAENCNRRIAGLTFQPYDQVAGTIMGVLKTSVPEEIAQLAALAANPASAVTEISESEYENLSKKKPPQSTALEHSNQPSRWAAPLKGKGAVVVEEPAPVAPVPEAKIESIEDLVKIAPVAPAAGADEPAASKRKK